MKQRTNYVMFPVRLVSQPLTAIAMRVYCNLMWRQGSNASCYPRISLIASDVSASVRQVKRALKELEGANLISVKRRPRRSSLYSIILTDEDFLGGAQGASPPVSGDTNVTANHSTGDTDDTETPALSDANGTKTDSLGDAGVPLSGDIGDACEGLSGDTHGTSKCDTDVTQNYIHKNYSNLPDNGTVPDHSVPSDSVLNKRNKNKSTAPDGAGPSQHQSSLSLTSRAKKGQSKKKSTSRKKADAHPNHQEAIDLWYQANKEVCGTRLVITGREASTCKRLLTQHGIEEVRTAIRSHVQMARAAKGGWIANKPIAPSVTDLLWNDIQIHIARQKPAAPANPYDNLEPGEDRKYEDPFTGERLSPTELGSRAGAWDKEQRHKERTA